MMNTIKVETQLQTTIDEDGVLRCELPTAFAGEDVVVTIIIERKHKQPSKDELRTQAKERARQTYARAYEPWDSAEELRLVTLKRKGRSIKEIAAILERQPGAIKSRLEKLGEK